MIRLLLSTTAGLLLLAGCTAENPSSDDGPAILHRFETNPIISPDHPGNVREWGYDNINGPSVIRVPGWVEKPLGKYYLYFAHHRGSFIRMAYADEIEGPWTILDKGVLHLAETPALDHIASPDVHVDDQQKRIRMFFHSVDDTTTWKQTTYLAESSDGLTFESDAEPKGLPYLRAFEMHGQWWAVAKQRGGPGGVLLQSATQNGPFTEGPLFLEGMRHAAVLPHEGTVDVVFSRIGDSPERLLLTTIEPDRMWRSPYKATLQELLTSETEYEGAKLPIAASAVGEELGPVHALRDPYILRDSRGTYLFYSIAGEFGIAAAMWRSQP